MLLPHTVGAYFSTTRTLLGVTMLLADAVALPGLAAHAARLIVIGTVLGAARPVRRIPPAVDLAHLPGLAQRRLAYLESGAVGVADELLALLCTRHLRLIDPHATLYLPFDACATFHRALQRKRRGLFDEWPTGYPLALTHRFPFAHVLDVAAVAHLLGLLVQRTVIAIRMHAGHRAVHLAPIAALTPFPCHPLADGVRVHL